MWYYSDCLRCIGWLKLKSFHIIKLVFLFQKISYTTLSAILEYIYTGEVVISIDNLSELIQTAKELHVKGLEDLV